MKTIVLKFGGASLKELSQFRLISQIIIQKKAEYENVLVVVSAMGKMTDELICMANQVSKNPAKRELDMLVSVGERISMSLLAMALDDMGVSAISFTGSQAGIITSRDHTDAKIIEVKPKRISSHLNEGKVVIVAGFQGVSLDGEVTTLGRGGSDTTALALAIALKAEMVEFYKDVKGIFSDDPKKIPDAQFLESLSYKEAMGIILKSERKLLHPRAILLAEKNNIPLLIRSFETLEKGSFITGSGLINVEAVYEVDQCLI
jgi:aspartate kinase